MSENKAAKLQSALATLRANADAGDIPAGLVLDLIDAAMRLTDERDALQARLDALHQEQEQLRHEIEQLRFVHVGEGTFACTCFSYPHAPNCGLNARLAAFQREVARLTAILDQVRAVAEKCLEKAQRLELLVATGQYFGNERERLLECAATRRAIADELTARLTEKD